MATATQQRTVVLSREQRDGLCELAWSSLFEGTYPTGRREQVKEAIGCGQLFDALQYAEENSAAETFELPVTPEITWLFREVLDPYGEAEREIIERDRFEKHPSENLLQYRATVAALDTVLDVA